MTWYQIIALDVIPGLIIGMVLLITPILSIDYTYAAHVPGEEECVIELKEYDRVRIEGGHMYGAINQKQFLDDNPGFKENTCWENRVYIYNHFRSYHPEISIPIG